MKEERIKALRKELKYLVDSEIDKEIKHYESKLNDEDIKTKDLAKEIYLKRGLNIKMIKKDHMGSLVDAFNDMISLFKSKDKAIRKKMIIDTIYIILIVILIKIPFDLVQDIGYEFIEALSSNILVSRLWDLAFALLYIISVICLLLVMIRNFNKKFKNTK